MRFLIASITVLISGSVYAGPAEIPPTARLMQGCDLSGTHVPAGYKGHDTIDLINKLAPLSKPKDDFETTSELEERQAQFLHELLADGAATRLCYVTDREGSYDTDSGTLWLHLFSELNAYTIKAPWRLAWWDGIGYRNKKVSTYSGTNAFGISRQITKTSQNGYFFAFNGDRAAFFSRDMGGQEQHNMYALPIRMDAATAREKKPRTRFVVQYSLVPPFVAKGISYETPTLDMPFETETRESYLLVKWEMVAAVDIKTGEILKRFDPSNSRENY